MFLLDVLIYVLFALVMIYFAKKSEQYYPRINNADFYLKFYIISFAIISGVRWGVGTDFFSYATQFDKGVSAINLTNRSSEVLWIKFVELFSQLDLHFSLGMGLVGLVQFLFIYLSLKKWKVLFAFLPIVIFGGWFDLALWNGMRQMIVACVFVYISKWIVERKFWKYILVVWLMHYIHNSALILIPLYFLPLKIQFSGKRNICMILFVICFILGQTPQFQNFVGLFTDFAQMFGYEDYVTQINAKLSGKDLETRALGPTMISYAILCFAVIFYSPKLKITFAEKIPYFELWYNFSLIYSYGFFLFCNVSHIFLRPLSYFMMFLMLMLTLLLAYFKIIRDKKKYVLLVVLLWIGLVWTVFKLSTTNDFNFITYKFIWNHSLNEIIL